MKTATTHFNKQILLYSFGFSFQNEVTFRVVSCSSGTLSKTRLRNGLQNSIVYVLDKQISYLF